MSLSFIARQTTQRLKKSKPNIITNHNPSTYLCRTYLSKLSTNPPSKTPLFYNNTFIDSNATEFHNVINPATQELVTQVPEITASEFNRAVESTKEAQREWAAVPASVRCRAIAKYARLVTENQDKIAEVITLEHGKTIADSLGDVFRGLEMIEFAQTAPSLLMGETARDISRNIDSYSYKEPLGVVAGICPFNFPAMIPLWMYPLATALGNGVILKPSEKTPTAANLLMELWAQVDGVPAGLINSVHGGKGCVDLICHHPDIKAVSFVGSNQAGEYIHQTATATNKRAQCNMGAKNHGTVLPDADKESTINALAGAAFGSSGQRCMALPFVLLVGAAKQWIPDFVETAKRLRLNAGHEPKTDISPMNTKAALTRAEMLIQSAIDEGAQVILDGRQPSVPGYPDGNFMAPTIITGVEPHMQCYTEEIFAPVLLLKCVDTLDEAIAVTNANAYGNGCALFTNNGPSARRYEREVNAGNIGINLPIPVPLPFFSFTGCKNSYRGSLHFYGKQGANFYTYTKTVTANWKFSQQSADMAFPRSE